MYQTRRSILNDLGQFVLGDSYQKLTALVIALCALAVLLGAFILPWLRVPPASLEHKVPITLISEIEARSPASRRQAIVGDIVLKIGTTELAQTANLEEVQAAYAQAVQEAQAQGLNEVVLVRQRGDEILEITNYPIPRANSAFELTIPQNIRTEDVGLTLEFREPLDLPNPDGTTVSAMQIWLGGKADFLSLDLASLEDTKTGFSHVRRIDRLLIIFPLAALVILLFDLLYLRGAINSERIFTITLGVLVLLIIFPIFWQINSSVNWRNYLRETYGRELEAEVISSNLVTTLNLPTLSIASETASRAKQRTDADIVPSIMIRFSALYDYSIYMGVIMGSLGIVGLLGVLYALAQSKALMNGDRLAAFIMILPSILLLGIFVYVFIAQTINYSFTDWGEEAKGAPPPLTDNINRTYIGLEEYEDLLTNQLEFKFRDSLINTFFFTVFFLIGCLAFGFLLAFLIDQRIKGEGLFRTIFLFPMSLSFVVTGTIWRWLFQQKGGVNVLPVKLTSFLPESLQLEAGTFNWMASNKTYLPFHWDDVSLFVYIALAVAGFIFFNHLLRLNNRRLIYLGLIALVFIAIYASGIWDIFWLDLDDSEAELEKGYKAALTGIIIAAVWQMSGYVMALFLAGIRGIPEDLREAARTDGCAEWQVYLYVILPSLKPIVLSAVIILGHISLKIFDLVFAMSGPDNSDTIVPGILLYTKAFRGNQLASGSAVAVIMLALVSMVIVPYLWSSLRQENS